MKEIPIFTQGTPPPFNVPTSQGDYWLQRLCYEQSVDRYNANTQGITQKVIEAADLATLDTAIGSDVGDYLAWLDDFLNDKTTEYAENLISMAPLMTAIASGGSSEILPLLFGHLFNVLMNGIQGREKGANDNTKEGVEGTPLAAFENFTLEINNDPQKGDVEGLWTIKSPPA